MSFLLGSVPFALVVSRSKGVDLRKHGSGNVGATNAFRVLGPAAGALVLLLDGGKGSAAAWLGSRLSGLPRDVGGMAGSLAAMAGHVFSPWLGFKGGKGAAVAAGAALYLFPREMGAALVAYAVLVVVTGYGSVGTLGAALLAAGLVLFRPHGIPIKAFVAVAVALVFVRHKSNIRRLMQGKELRLHPGLFSKRETNRRKLP